MKPAAILTYRFAPGSATHTNNPSPLRWLASMGMAMVYQISVLGYPSPSTVVAAVVLSRPMVRTLESLREAVHAHHSNAGTLGDVVEDHVVLLLQSLVFLVFITSRSLACLSTVMDGEC